MQPKDNAEAGTESKSRLTAASNHPYQYRVLLALAKGGPEERIRIGPAVFEDDAEEPDILKHQLYDDHLPQLDDAQLISWDGDTGVITRGPRFDEMRQARLSSVAERHGEANTDV
jgi:hypothetical protein